MSRLTGSSVKPIVIVAFVLALAFEELFVSEPTEAALATSEVTSRSDAQIREILAMRFRSSFVIRPLNLYQP